MHARLDELLNLREQLRALPPAPEPAIDGGTGNGSASASGVDACAGTGAASASGVDGSTRSSEASAAPSAGTPATASSGGTSSTWPCALTRVAGGSKM